MPRRKGEKHSYRQVFNGRLKPGTQNTSNPEGRSLSPREQLKVLGVRRCIQKQRRLSRNLTSEILLEKCR